MDKFEFKNYKDGRELDFIKDYPLAEVEENSAAHIIYTIRHKKAILMTYIELTGKIPSMDSRLWLHDMDKVYLYYHLQNVKVAHALHVQFSPHHYPNWRTLDDKREAVLDYECARITKPDKPRNALETIRVFRPETEGLLIDILKEWGINTEERKDFEFKLFKYNKDFVEETLYQKMKDYMKEFSLVTSFEKYEEEVNKKIMNVSID